MISTPLPPYSFCKSPRCGISMRHGPHQVAHRSTTTTLSLKSDRRNFAPSTACISVFQAVAGTVSSCGGGCGCPAGFEVMVTCGVRLACAALLFADRFAVSFDLQLEAASAAPTNAAHASTTRVPVQ